MNFGDEIENTKGLIEEIEHYGVENLEDSDNDVIKFFINHLEPYLNVVEMNINMLETRLQDTYSKEDEKKLNVLEYKSKELNQLIPTLKDYSKKIA